MSKMGRQLPAISPNAAYIRGDGCAGSYLGFRDKAGRAFRQWAKERKIPYSLINGIPVYRIADLDKAWKASVEFKMFFQQEPVALKANTPNHWNG